MFTTLKVRIIHYSSSIQNGKDTCVFRENCKLVVYRFVLSDNAK